MAKTKNELIYEELIKVICSFPEMRADFGEIYDRFMYKLGNDVNLKTEHLGKISYDKFMLMLDKLIDNSPLDYMDENAAVVNIDKFQNSCLLFDKNMIKKDYEFYGYEDEVDVEEEDEDTEVDKYKHEIDFDIDYGYLEDEDDNEWY